MLAREDLRQIAQRITARFHLDPLSRDETFAYVRHRLRVAGATTEYFTRAALREIYRVSGGIPRVINILCDRALLGAYTQELHQVPALMVRRAGAEVFGHEFLPRWMPATAAGLAVAVLVGSALLLWRYAPARVFRPSRMPRTRPWRPMRRLPTRMPQRRPPQLPQPPSPAPRAVASDSARYRTGRARRPATRPGVAAPGAAASPAASDHTLAPLLSLTATVPTATARLSS